MSKPTAIFVNNCISKYTELFPDDWILGLDWTTLEEANRSFGVGRERVLEFQRQCFENIALSFLSGEYIVDRKKFDSVKSSFARYWQQEHLCPELPDEDHSIFKIRSRLYQYYEELDNHIRALFYAYSHFVISVDEKLEYAQHEYLFKVDTQGLRETQDFRYFLYLRKIFIPLCDIEHQLEFDDSVRTRIAVYIEQLEQILAEEQYDAIKKVLQLAIYKTNFILRKLLRPSDSFDILVNEEKKTLSRLSLPALPESLGRKFLIYECIHEDRTFNDTDVAQLQTRINKGIGSFEDIACLIDYYCKNNGSIQQINNLITQFDIKFNKLNQRYHYNFDRHALCTLRNFLYNCRLSYNTSKKSYSVDELISDMEIIKSMQLETLVRNFYPYKKALEFLSREIRNNIENRNLKFEYQKFINLFEEFLSEFKFNINWCESHKFYPIQLPFKECRVKIDNQILIIPSTITRPIDYNRLREEQQRFQSELDFFKSSQIYFKDKNETESLRDEVNNIEKRYLEIGGVLIGLVTFLFGTIDIFTKSEGSSAYMFESIFGLGLILVIFAALLIIVIEYWKGNRNNIRIVFCSVILVVYTILIVCSLNRNQDSNPNQSKEDFHTKQENDITDKSSETKVLDNNVEAYNYSVPNSSNKDIGSNSKRKDSVYIQTPAH